MVNPLIRIRNMNQDIRYIIYYKQIVFNIQNIATLALYDKWYNFHPRQVVNR